MSINSLSLFELLTYLARRSEQLRLRDKAFPSGTNLVHFSAQTLRHVYVATIADYVDVVEILHGVTGSSIRNVCTEFGIYIPQFFVLFSLHN